MNTKLAKFIMNSEKRLGLPINVYCGLPLTKATVRDLVTNPAVQYETTNALQKRYQAPFILTAMDLSAEAEAFGCQVRLTDDEIPTVLGRLVTSREDLENLSDPSPGEKRTQVHLETARKIAAFSDHPIKLACMIGPFSLAGRLFGVSETLELTLTDPDLVYLLLEKVTRFLIRYADAFRQVGMDGLIIAEPAAGLLSPRSLALFSSPFVKSIIDAVQNENFTILLHNCGARINHLPKILETGGEIFHFGAPMDIELALEQVNGNVVLCGNLDPTTAFFNSTPEEVFIKTQELLIRTKQYKNFVVSSGCDLPPGTPLENLDAFYKAIKEQPTF
jgi:uroporphyrinogen decarboxylase